MYQILHFFVTDSAQTSFGTWNR